MDNKVKAAITRSVVLMEETMDRIPITDWQDEFKLRIEDAEEMRDCIEQVHKWLNAMLPKDTRVQVKETKEKPEVIGITSAARRGGSEDRWGN